MQRAYLPIILFFACLITFSSVLKQNFIWNDYELVFETGHVYPPSEKNFKNIWKNVHQQPYTPVANSMILLLNKISQDPSVISTAEPHPTTVISPIPYKICAFLLHTLNAILVYLILNMFLKKIHFNLLASLVFAIHPLQTEVLSRIALLPQLFGAFLAFVSILLYLSYSKRLNSSSRFAKKSNVHLYTAMICCIAAVLTNIHYFILPFILFILEKLLPRERSVFHPKKPIFPLILLLILILPFTFWQMQTSTPNAISFWQKPFMMTNIGLFYILNFIFPLNLTIDYHFPIRELLSSWWFYVTWLIPTFILSSVIFWRNKNKISILLVLMIMFLSFLPYSGFFDFNFKHAIIVSDSFTYFSLFTIVFLGSTILNQYKKNINFMLFPIPVILLTSLSIYQLKSWKDETHLWQSTLLANPKSSSVHLAIGEKYKSEKNWEKAIEHFNIALESNRNLPQVLYFLASQALEKNQNKDAIALFEETLQYNANHSDALFHLGILLRHEKPIESQNYLSKAVSSDPTNANFQLQLAKSYLLDQKYNEAIPFLKNAITLTHQTEQKDIFIMSQTYLGIAMLKTGQPQLAQIHLEHVLNVNSSQTQATELLAKILNEEELHEESLIKILSTIHQDGNNTRNLKLLGDISFALKKYKDAKENYLLIKDKSLLTNDVLLKLGIASYHLNELEAAQTYFNQVLQSEQKSFEPYYYLGEILYSSGKADASFEKFRFCIQFNEKSIACHQRLVELYSKKGNKEKVQLHKGLIAKYSTQEK